MAPPFFTCTNEGNAVLSERKGCEAVFANTRRIPRLPFPRRFRKFGRRRKPAFSWTNGNFNNSTFATNSTLSRIILVEHSDFDPSGTTLVAQSLRIHRAQVDFHIGLEAGSALGASFIGWQWALWVEDSDEPDAQLWNVSGNLFPQKQILLQRSGLLEFIAVGQEGVGQVTSERFNKSSVIPIRFDLRFRKPLHVGVDQQLTLGFQFADDYNLAGTLGDGVLFGLQRLVVQLPGSGR